MNALTQPWYDPGTNQIVWPNQTIYTSQSGAKVPPAPPLVTTIATHELVMELIARGFAVAKMPAEELAEQVVGG